VRISQDAIYRALYYEGRGALKCELVACLRAGRALPVQRARSRQKAWARVTPEVLISEGALPKATTAPLPGHGEGDLVIGLQRSAVGIVAERATRLRYSFTSLMRMAGVSPHARRMVGAGWLWRGHDGQYSRNHHSVFRAIAFLTWDRGKQLSACPIHRPDRAARPLRRPVFTFAELARTKTQKDCCLGTSRKVRPLSLDRRENRRSRCCDHLRSRRDTGVTSTIESAQHRKFRYTHRRAEAKAVASRGKTPATTARWPRRSNRCTRLNSSATEPWRGTDDTRRESST